MGPNEPKQFGGARCTEVTPDVQSVVHGSTGAQARQASSNCAAQDDADDQLQGQHVSQRSGGLPRAPNILGRSADLLHRATAADNPRVRKRAADGDASQSDRPVQRIRDGASPPFRRAQEAVPPAGFIGEPRDSGTHGRENRISTGSMTSRSSADLSNASHSAESRQDLGHSSVPEFPNVTTTSGSRPHTQTRGGNGRSPPTEPAAMRRAAAAAAAAQNAHTRHTLSTNPPAAAHVIGRTSRDASPPPAPPIVPRVSLSPGHARASRSQAACMHDQADVLTPPAPVNRIPIIPASTFVPVPAPGGPQSLTLPTRCEFCDRVFTEYRAAIDHVLYTHLLNVMRGTVAQALLYLRPGAMYDRNTAEPTIPSGQAPPPDLVRLTASMNPVAALLDAVAPVQGSAPAGRYVQCARCRVRFAPPAPNQIDEAIMHALYSHVNCVARGAIAQAESHLHPAAQ
ncbi:hypothetical protein AURDEDRAFT_183993 [Auricularia subglabra TFB-10046 SS5]|nr:hypothetical protein AURDEDRAFT_183993 [Auricularia subglabra TFB-10046 SS5]